MNVSIPFSNSMAHDAVSAGPRSNPVLPDRAVDCRPVWRVRRGITLVEMLVALAVTLLMMGAVVTVFGFIGERVTDSRGLIETNDRLRSASHRLREDLTNITLKPIPWQRPEEGAGYLEILEGKARDARDATGTYANPNSPQAMVGDYDDVWMGTIRTPDEPYRSKFGSAAIESNTAEVIWYLRPTTGVVTNPPTYSLCRRQLLIIPQAAIDAVQPPPPRDATFYNLYDVSARVDSMGGIVANTLGDLTKRENRFKHGAGYPHQVNINPATGIRAPSPPEREGEEVVLTNVLSFNIQVYDPVAEIRLNGNAALEPDDPGYANTAANNNSIARGAYMDLGDPIPGAVFGQMNQVAAQKSLLIPVNGFWTYDTWSFHYEHDGIRQQSAQLAGLTDAGTNGLDDNPMQYPGVDDMSERETSPPYPYPLRGLRVKIRVYEPSSKQVREVTVVQSFVPE